MGKETILTEGCDLPLNAFLLLDVSTELRTEQQQQQQQQQQ